MAVIEPLSPGPTGSDSDITVEKQAAIADTKEITPVSSSEDSEAEVIINTGELAAKHLLPLRDDGEAALTFRSVFLASGLSAFQAAMSQIYSFKPTQVGISGIFIVLIAYFLGLAWALFLPRGDLLEVKWREKGGQGKPPFWIRFWLFVNGGRWNLKEHAVCAITANSASNASASITVFTAQKLFYDLPISATTVVLSTMSIGLFGYGLCGLFRPISVWHVESVYWANIPTVKTIQGLHWQETKSSKPMRYFWYAFGTMFAYEFFPAYIIPWLNSVSIPCLAAMNATGAKGAILTNLFGGATNNEGLGLFSVSFDWQYITTAATSLPLKMQVHSAVGFLICFLAMLGIYYNDVWGSRSQPFMSTRLRAEGGGAYPVGKVFVGGVLDEVAFKKAGVPRLTGSFAYAMLMANAGIGALIAHVILFWGKDVVKSFKSAREGRFDDRHHAHMAKKYKEAPWWWYGIVLVGSFVIGLAVVLKENITLPAWAYVVSIILGAVIAPFSVLLLARFGNGIATNNLSKMIAGLMLPGRPIGNMYFAAWSHSMIANCVNLSSDLKMGEYLKVPPRVMFLTQLYGTALGAIVNYVVMISIVASQRTLLVDKNGNASWSGATLQSYNTNATSWALAKYLYTTGARYAIVPLGLVIGAGIVVFQRILTIFVPKIRNFKIADINTAQLLQYAGFIPYNQSQTCVIFSQIIAGFYVQFYLRNYRPRIFKDYSYLVTAAWDGAALTTLFILSFSVFGAGGNSSPFPVWWGNWGGDSGPGNYDHCPVVE
ncbi:hypothetical protein VHEMI06910 [[Torrubiella] hemipterigena]|uniref:OPT oligopeptide transporter n=1 Tax=[Torrubiella] hemipterigena TaxID=1531966 RepID=A0A0A1TM07_9HYPO|nr:hypothetical protein VHEMI06910 [[Torrubiella] hemipterigena]